MQIPCESLEQLLQPLRAGALLFLLLSVVATLAEVVPFEEGDNAILVVI